MREVPTGEVLRGPGVAVTTKALKIELKVYNPRGTHPARLAR